MFLLCAGLCCLLLYACSWLPFYFLRPRFQGQLVWITGASSGIGEQLAVAFAEAGASLLLSARNIVELDRVRKRCAQFTTKVNIIPLDLNNPTEILYTAQQVSKRFPVDILINNAGVTQQASIQSSLDSLLLERRLYTVNYLGQIALTKAVLPAMVTRGYGHIVYMSDITALTGALQQGYYCSAKAAVSAYMESLRAEVAQHMVRVTTLFPGEVQSNARGNALGPEGNRAGGTHANTGMTVETFANTALRHIYWQSPEAVIAPFRTQISLYTYLHFLSP